MSVNESIRSVVLVFLLVGSAVSPALATDALSASSGGTGPAANALAASGNTGTASGQALAVANSESVTFIDGNGTTTTVEASASVLGSMAHLDGDDHVELPFVRNGTLKTVDATGAVQQLATGAKASATLLGTGDWDENGRTGVLYVNASDGNELYRAEIGSEPQRVLDVPAAAVLGITDFDGDADADVVFVGESGGIKYFDDGRVRSTGYYDIGGSETLGAGAPADFDGDGVARVPVVSASGDLVLVDATGEVGVVKSDYDTASTGALSAFDWTGGAGPEILHVGNDGRLRYADLDGSVGVVRDANGSAIAADSTVGVSAYPPTNRNVTGSENATTVIRAVDATTNVTATHEVTYPVAENSTQVGTSLDSVEVQYPNESVDVRDVTAGDVVAGIDRDGDGAVDAGLGATDAIESVVAVENSTLRVAFNGTDALEANDTVVVRYANVTNPGTAGEYPITVVLNDAENRTGSVEFDAPLSSPVEATVTRIGPNEASMTAPTVDAGGTLTADLPTTELAAETGVALSQVNLTFEADAHTNATFTQVRNLSVPAVGANDSNVTGLSHFRLSGASPTSEEVETARFRFSVNASALSQDPDEVGLYRYVNDSWSRLPTTLVAANDSTYTFVADSPGVGRFAVATEDGLQQAPDAIESVEVVEEIDRDGDGNASDFAVRIDANTSVALDNGSVGDPFYEVYVDGERQRVLGVTANGQSNETVVLSSHQLRSDASKRDVRVVLWDDDEYDENESGRDRADAASTAVTYESVESDATTNATNLSVAIDSGDIYAEMHNQSLNASYWERQGDDYANATAERVRDELENQIEGTTYRLYDYGEGDPLLIRRARFIRDTSADVISEAPSELTGGVLKGYANIVASYSRAQTLRNVIAGGAYFVRGAQSHAVARHLDNPGYNSQNYTRLHENLQALSENSDELEAARAANDTSRVTELLEERKLLLNETYQLVPAYADETHQSVVNDLAGEEDLQSYEVTRQILAVLRNALRTDYTATSRALDGYPGTLGGTTDMPTNGWTVQYSTRDDLGAEWQSYLTSRRTVSEEIGEILGRLLTPNELYPTADRYGDSVVYDSMDGFEDYTVYRIDMDTDADKPGQRKLTVALSRPNRRSNAENLTRFDAVLTQEAPENISNVDGRQLRNVDDSDSTMTQKRTFEATNDTYYLVVRSNITVGMYQMTATTERPGTTGSDGGTAVEVIDRQGADAQRPSLTLSDAPSAEKLRHGQRVHVSSDGSVWLTWHAWDVGSSASELEYKYRVSNDTGTSNWSSWKTVDNEGYVHQSLSLSEGYHDVQMVVRDSEGYRTERIVTVKTDVTAPDVSVSSVGSARSPLVRTQVDERVRYVKYQYHDANETGNWTDWRRINNTADLGLLPFDAGPGTYELRGRAVDLAGRQSDWDATVFTVNDTEENHTIFPGDGSDDSAPGDNITDGGNVTGNETLRFNTSDGYPDDISDGESFGTDGFGGYRRVGVGLEGIEGETISTIWLDTRNFPRVKVASINLTADETVTLTELVPPELWANTEIIIEFRGDGTAHLKHVNLTRATPMFVDATPGRPSVNENVTFEASTVEGYRDHVQQVEWDLDGDEVYETTGWNATQSFSTEGTGTVRMRGTNDHNETVVVTKTVEVNAKPSVTVNGSNTVSTHETAKAWVVNASDPDGSVVSYEWDVDDDGRYEQSGRTVYTAFETDGPHEVTVRVTDDANGTATATHTVDVANRVPAPAVDQSVVAVEESVELSATDASDPDGEIVTYEWDLDGDGTYEKTGESITAVFNETGTANVTLRATDDDGAINTTTHSVTVTHRPSVEIRDLGNVTEDAEHTFEANASDPDGTVVAYDWTFGDLTAATGATVNHTYTSTGRYTITVTVEGDRGLTASDSVNLTVNSPPSAHLVANDTVLNTSEAVELDGSSSADPNDVDSLSYEWTLGDGTAASDSSVVHRYDSAGEYVVELVVADEFGASDTAAVNLTVDDAPTAAGDVTPSEPNPGETVTFDASASNDPNANDSLSYEWTFGDGTTATGTNVAHTYDSGGDYPVTLTVTDSYGKSDTANWTVSVNHPPTADATTSKTTVNVSETVTFDASGSSDPDGDSLTYEWDFDGDGSVDATGVTPSWNYSAAGTYRVTLDVTDEGGTTDSETVTITVESNSFFDGFEDGVGDWTEYRGLSQSSNSYNGSYSAHVSKHGSFGTHMASNTVFSGGERPSQFSVYLREKSYSGGGGIRLYNSEGNPEVGFAFNNPQWILDDGDGQSQIYGGDGYKRWVYVEFTFDWSSNSYDYYVKDLQSGHVETGTRSLKHGLDIETVYIDNFDNKWGDHHSDDIELWIDDVRLDMGDAQTAGATVAPSMTTGKTGTFDASNSSDRDSNSPIDDQNVDGDDTTDAVSATRPSEPSRIDDTTLVVTDERGGVETAPTTDTVERST